MVIGLWQRFVRWAFVQLYTRFAWAYDGVAALVGRGQWKMWGRVALSYVKGRDVLEIGCGPGHLLVDLTQKGYWTVGLDLSAAMLRLARHNLQACGVSTRLVRGRAESLPFAEKTFDAVVMTFPAAFALLPETLAETHRVLRPEGCLVWVDRGRHLGCDPWSRFLNWAMEITSAPQVSEDTAQVLNSVSSPGKALTFEASVHEHHLPRSVVQVIVARKILPEGQSTSHARSSS